MKTENIHINKTSQRPDGIPIEIVQPESPLEEQVISFFLSQLVADLKRQDKLPYELPPGFRIQHTKEGTFVLVSGPGEGSLYEPRKPIAILGLRQLRRGAFDLIHASATSGAAAPTPQSTPQPAAVADTAAK